MKPIIINMNEMSDSREVYDSKPNRALPVFLYTILALLTVAVVWMCFGTIDVTVKASGMLRPNEAVNTVVNTVGGEVIASDIEDGGTVQEGDLLYVISHEELLTKKEFYEKQKTYYETQFAGLTDYLASVKEETNHFADMDSEYAERYRSFQIQLDAMRLELQTDTDARAYTKNTLESQLTHYEGELKQTKTLLASVQGGKSKFGAKEDNAYATRYQMYLSEYKALKKQYSDKQKEIESSVGEESLVNSEEYYREMAEGLECLIRSIELEKDCFDYGDVSLYANQYASYETKRSELSQAYQRAEDTYAINQALVGIAVSAWEVEESRIAKEQAKNAYETYKTSTLSELKGQLNEVQAKLDEVTLNQSVLVEKDTLLEENTEAKEDALERFRLSYVVELNDAITALEERIETLKNQIAEVSYATEKVPMYKNGEATEYASVRKYKSDEIVAIQQSLSSCETALNEVNAQLAEVEQAIDDCYVTAPCSGVVNVMQEPIVGNVIAAGTEVLSVLPAEGSGYKCLIYVENADVGGLQVGMPVKFNLYSYPNAEYGYVHGTLTKVAKDIRVDSGSGMAYYQAEATVDVGSFVDATGTPISLKAGMACEAKIITEEKRIISFVLEKLNLLFTK